MESNAWVEVYVSNYVKQRVQVEGKYNKCTCTMVVVEAYNMYNLCELHVWKMLIYLFKKSIGYGQGGTYN